MGMKMMVPIILLWLLVACGGSVQYNGESDAPYPYDAYVVESIILGEEIGWPLGGYLTLPIHAHVDHPVPAVVLVHGSGPANRDGAIANMRVFADVAHYLSQNGIAVLRYDKRTYVHGTRMVQALGGSLTVWEETIEDAIIAADFLRMDPRINRIYLLGWSLGGALAPRIHASGGDFDGLILFAATPRPLLDVGVEQFFASLAVFEARGLGDHPEIVDFRTQLHALIDFIEVVPTLTTEEAKATTVPLFGVSVYYFREKDAFPFSSMIAKVDVPMLVMQGQRDYQVLADVDFVMLTNILDGREDITFILYEDLDHFFMPTTAQNHTEHAEIGLARLPGVQVDAQVLQNIVTWIWR